LQRGTVGLRFVLSLEGPLKKRLSSEPQRSA
jgi:hypothetical protein